MEASYQITQDSRSLDYFFKSNKSQIKKQKKEMKEIEKQKRRKNSTQLSLFGWLVKNRPKQNSSFIHLPKNIMVNIYSYLRISEIVKISQTCFYLHECSRCIWNDSDFFKQLQTDKLSSEELKKIFEKGGKMYHIKQLKNIYLGKNLKSCRQKIKIKIHENNNHTLKPVAGNLLEVFQVSTKVHKSSAFLMDNHLQEVIASSFRSLISIKLQACRYVRKFYDISKCTQLITLFITQNSYLTNEDMRIIVKCCSRIQNLDLSGCDNLDQGIFKHISKLLNLKKLSMNNYQQPFGDLQCMKVLTSLKEVSIQNSCIVDLQGIQLVKELDSLVEMNINGCQLLTDFFIESVMSIGKYHKVHLSIGKNKFGTDVLKQWLEFSTKNEGKEDIKNNQ